MPNLLSIKLDSSQLEKKLTSIQSGLKDMEKPLVEIGDDLLKFYGDEVFKTQGKAIGESWRPLAPATLQLRAERRGHYARPPIAKGKILTWTGDLMKGFRKQTTRTRLVVDNTIDYFKYHQKAGGRPPQRRMLAITSRVITMVITKLNKYASNLVE